jgi:hypothetical protein
MTILEEKLKRFKKLDKIKGDNAPQVFKQIAHAMLNGGFRITSTVSNKVVIVKPISVEIYYHEEDGDNKDYIVYHRNPKNSTTRPYFKLGTLNNHVSGIDITFESEKENYRSSALIRAFSIIGASSEDIRILEIPDSSNEERSTYIYNALFSEFSIFEGFSIIWEDNIEPYISEDLIHESVRKNVAQFENGIKKKIDGTILPGTMVTDDKSKILDTRKWRFSTYEPQSPKIIQTK